MKQIVECVPNFSEGRDSSVIKAIAETIEQSEGCRLLDVDAGRSTNRTVYTFVGPPQAVLEGALSAARVAKQLIDMQIHTGEHHRMGALDVCPFIPVSGISMDECVELSKQFGQRLGEELGVPVYLYEASSDRTWRKTLTQIREGQYEGLKKKLQMPEWEPDFGPAQFIPGWGATVTGARSFLIAYNVNLISTPNQAHRIALNLREAGRGEDEPGRLKHVQGMGWFVDEYNLAQVTVNLTDFNVTPPHLLYEEVKKDAKKLNVAVSGSEIVGGVPLEAILVAADYYIEKENLFILDEDQKVRLAMERLGLNSVAPFEPDKKIIEYIIAEKRDEPLAGASLRAFIEGVGARSAAPGGGSASAAIAAMGAGLGAMAAKLTLGVRKYENLDARMRQIVPVLHQVSCDLIPMIDKDTDAFKDVVAAQGLPENTEEEKSLKASRIQEGLKKAVDIPLTTMEMADSAWEAMAQIARHGSMALKSDMQVGAKALETGIWGAYQNVMINMADIRDAAFKNKVLARADKMKKRAEDQRRKILEILSSRTES